MIKIFSYGTLWQSDIQLKVFGSTFSVDPHLDYISGWDLIKIKMYGGFFNMAVKGESIIMGAIVNIPDDLIDSIDKYEGLEYKRIKITTLTGTDCQIYVKR